MIGWVLNGDKRHGFLFALERSTHSTLAATRANEDKTSEYQEGTNSKWEAASCHGELGKGDSEVDLAAR